MIELKAPKKLLNAQDSQQIKSYAYAVSGDERFKGINTTWRFWLVGNDLHEFVEKELDNDEAQGVLQRTADGKMTISVRRWSELIHEARARLEFVQKELNYEVNRDDALERLRLTYAHILGGGMRALPLRVTPRTQMTRTNRMRIRAPILPNSPRNFQSGIPCRPLESWGRTLLRSPGRHKDALTRHHDMTNVVTDK